MAAIFSSALKKMWMKIEEKCQRLIRKDCLRIVVYSGTVGKREAYEELVKKRKSCRLCCGLSNPSYVSDGKYDSNEIGPWSLWQSNLNAELLIVGQDWGDISYFQKWEGRDQPAKNPTNENLQDLLAHIDIQIGKPREIQGQVIFFTNLILCFKQGGLQSPVKNDWLINCTREFFRPLIEIINPRVILALGKRVSESILDRYKIPYSKNKKLYDIMQRSPYELTSSTVLFPLYHCGAGSINRNRPMIEQKKDWTQVSEWMRRRSEVRMEKMT
ncbi:MAG: uracil-DNA glycosylase family protein [Nitrospiraceae bacterium]|nr:uracil-DNA glycosylase family protein [Nitrospiraceae bacterium]